VPVTYDPWLVLMSIVVAVMASFVALELASRLAATRGTSQARYWLAGGALAMGAGIWSMHFVGMLAPMSYDVSITLLSLAIAISVSGFALYTASRETLSTRRLWLGGLLMGLGIAGMHYTGMAAMHMQPPIRYDPALFALSILIAIVASGAALWIAFRLRMETFLTAFRYKAASALVMGAAIVGMHYTGMAAAIIAPHSVFTDAPQDIDNSWLGFSLAGFTLTLLLMSLVLSWLDVRMAKRKRKARALRASEERFRAIIGNSHEAFVAMDADGRITDWNEEAANTLGWTREEALGRELGGLIIPERYRSAHRAGMARFAATGQSSVIGKRMELVALHRDGRELPVELTIGTTASTGTLEFFAFLRDISEREELSRKLLFLAHHDVLTSLPNRTVFQERLKRAMARTRRTHRSMALMYLDIDYFKRVNDGLGHAAGDELLKRFAERIKASVRETDTVARLGGDEFTVVAEDLGVREDAASVAAKIVREVGRGFEIGGRLLPVTTTIGVAIYRGQAIDADTLLHCADEALYRAKRAGRNTFEIHEYAGGETAPAESFEAVLNQGVESASASGGIGDLLRMAAPAAITPDALVRQAGQRGQGELDQFLRTMLAAIRVHLGLDVAFISEFAHGRRIFRHVDGGIDDAPIQVGDSDPLDDSYCQRVVDGRLPELIRDAFDNPTAMELPVTRALPVRAHVSVPIRFEDDEVYGTFCCFSTTPDSSLNERDLGLMRTLADIAANLIARERAGERAYNAMRRRVQSALSGEGSSIVYQPIWDLRAGRLAGFEALSRFTAEPLRTPDAWYEEASRVGLGIELEIMTARKALADLAALPASTYLSLNVSPETLLSGELERALETVPFGRVVLEVTEHQLIEEYETVGRVLHDLRTRGLRVAVDDAGAGHASFRHILKLSPDFIKLDMSLTRDIDTNGNNRALAAALIRFAQETGSTIIAEGIETQGELDTLRELGVLKGQGYLLGAPMSLDQAVDVPRGQRLSPGAPLAVVSAHSDVGATAGPAGS
jgi:diguanylate cyclase (GGDEF)-like protein/PAS domain S-box-containing protein